MLSHLCRSKGLIVPKVIRLRYISDLEQVTSN